MKRWGLGGAASLLFLLAASAASADAGTHRERADGQGLRLGVPTLRLAALEASASATAVKQLPRLVIAQPQAVAPAKAPPPPSVTERWWFWAAVGGVIVTTAVVLVIATSGDETPGTDLGNMEAFRP